MTLVLGVDGGGRKTYAVVADEHGEVLGTGQAGASNWEIAGADGARAAIASAGARRRRSVGRRVSRPRCSVWPDSTGPPTNLG